MECIEAARALKPSLRGEMKSFVQPQQQQQVYCDDDDVWGQSVFTGSSSGSGEDVFVDDLFDFSNGKEFELQEEEFKDSFSEESSQEQDREIDDHSNSSGVSCFDDFQSLSAAELAVPDDDLASLEWLSHFVDDSVPVFPISYPAGDQKTGGFAKNRYEHGFRTVQMIPVCVTQSVPVKPRSKRTRTGRRTWSFLTDSWPSSSLSSITNLAQSMDFYEFEKPAKKPKRRSKTVESDDSGGSQGQRKCSHCHVTKTPQWRTGPQGAKTLCNACGVRFKSGRLFPEYRPACSPTFCEYVHSNSHRKVLEMRKRKDMGGPDSNAALEVSVGSSENPV